MYTFFIFINALVTQLYVVAKPSKPSLKKKKTQIQACVDSVRGMCEVTFWPAHLRI